MNKKITKSTHPFPTHLVFFLAPAVLIYTFFMILPLLDSIRMSFYHIDEHGFASYVGLDNYVLLLTDPSWAQPFFNALWNNLKFFILHMLIQNPIGILLAALLSLPKLKLRSSYRTMIFMPTMLSVVIIGFSWQLILSPLWGVSESMLAAIGLDDFFAPWLGQQESVLITLSLISVWQWVGIPMMLIYAALLSIPEDILDAAVVDGANNWRIFWSIKLPLIMPTIALVSVLTFVANFNAFDIVYAIKGALAGPNFSADLLGTFFYRTFFGFQLQLGSASMGATVATMIFLLILIGVCFYLYIVQRRLQRYQY